MVRVMEIKPQGNESENSFPSPVIVTPIIFGRVGGGVHYQFFIYTDIMLLAVYNEWLLRVPPGVIFKNSTWCSPCVECFVRISEQTATCATCSIN